MTRFACIHTLWGVQFGQSDAANNIKARLRVRLHMSYDFNTERGWKRIHCLLRIIVYSNWGVNLHD